MENIKIERNNNKVVGIVSKTFAKRANLFGTPEFYQWEEFLKYYKDAEMKITPSKSRSNDEPPKEAKINTKNLSYVNMRGYIKSLNLSAEKEAEALEEFDNIKMRSKIQPNPYKYVREWFVVRYSEYRTYLEKKEAENASENTAKSADA